MAAGMVTGDGLTRQERYLVHQVHPAKLATDIGVAAVSTVLFWRHRLVLGLLVFLVPVPVASVLVLRGDLSAYRIPSGRRQRPWAVAAALRQPLGRALMWRGTDRQPGPGPSHGI